MKTSSDRRARPSRGVTVATEFVTRIGKDAFRTTACRWTRAATRSSVGSLNRPAFNREVLRALLWSLPACADDDEPEILRQLIDFSNKSRTNQAVAAGFVLALMNSRASLAALTLLAEQSRRPTPRQRFARLAEHVRVRLDVPPEEAAEFHVPTFGFDASGLLVERIGPARAELRVSGREVITTWFNDTGKPVRSVPAAAKETSPDRVALVQAIARDAAQLLSAQRTRLDQLMRLPCIWSHDVWRRRYHDHPLLGRLTRALLWLIDETPVEVTSGLPRRIDGSDVRTTPQSLVRLWHPVSRPVEEVRAWRQRLELLNVTQPFKQAHRELYLLTDAERATGTHSNRFAAHVLRQHQFASLARARGWTWHLIGAWDTDTHAATLSLPHDRLRVEFWVQPINDDDTTDVGILRHVSTDQVRFYAEHARQPFPLEQVPALAFSETLRDIDLFVAVASVGNDPTWQDGGPDGRYRDYWQSYSFGELAESAKTRRQVLQRLVPRLKIASRCSFTDRFLVVRGDLRTYKIHLGSGNILMEPNDQYLCIVPDRSAARGSDGRLLPFEGDQTLSVIRSKAFLLADDRNIEDPSITHQIQPA